jgi:hypothetical protein
LKGAVFSGDTFGTRRGGVKSMKIVDRVHYVRDAVAADYAANGTLGEELQTASFKAILGGIESEDWANYMSLFADSEEQLSRLRGTDALSTNEPWVKVQCAYLAGGGVCGGMTPSRLLEFVTSAIDFNINDTAPNPAVTGRRPFQIP